MEETATTLLINELADKLGTTAEYLWGVLIKQAPIDGTVSLLIVLLLSAMSYWGFKFVCKKTTPQGDNTDAEWKNEGCFFAWFTWVLFTMMTVIITFSSASSIITAFINPEYWALNKLL
jgi:hypothetical protein